MDDRKSNLIKIPNRKIEDRVITALNTIIDEHPTMDPHINRCDKEMSWDGFIRIFNDGDTGSDKKNYEADIPIQVKGHVDKQNKYLNKDRIKYSVSLDDLNVYFKAFGCLYFQIFISENEKEKQVFYNSLYPSKIKTYLRFAKNNRNRTSFTIPFIRLKEGIDNLDRICRQFSIEMVKQGSGRGQIVEHTIDVSNLQRVNKLHFTAVGVNDPQEALRLIATGDVVAYGSYEDDDIQYPIEWGDHFIAVMGHYIDAAVCVNNRKYYERFGVEKCVMAADAKELSNELIVRISLSSNLFFEIHKSCITFQFSVNTDIMQISKDAEFIISMVNAGGFRLGTNNISFNGSDLTKAVKQRLEGLVEVGKALEDIGCKIFVPFKDFTKEDKAQLDLLVEIKKKIKTFKTDLDYFVYDWKFRDKIFPFIVYKSRKVFDEVEKNRDEVNLIEFMFSRTLKVSLGSPEEDRGEEIDTLPNDAYIVPNFIKLSLEQLSNLYYYDYESMFDQIDSAVINQATEPELDRLALSLISAYDINRNERLLEVSEALIVRLAEHDSEALNNQINLMQIEKRRFGNISEENKKRLPNLIEAADKIEIKEGMGNMGEIMRFCADVLLEDRRGAKERYMSLSEDDRKCVDGFPIMKLYDELINCT